MTKQTARFYNKKSSRSYKCIANNDLMFCIGERYSFMEKKKNRKLLFQIGVVIVPLCLLMLALFAGTVYRSTLDAYLKSQKGRMAQELDHSFGTILSADGYLYGADFDGWCYDYLISHPELVRDPITDEERQVILQKMWDGENVWDMDWLEQQSEEIQNLCARLWLFDTSEMAKYISGQNSYEDIFLIDVNKGREGLVYFYYSKDNDRFSSGDIMPYRLSDHPAIQKLLEDPSLSEAFERVHDFPDKGSYNYICYKPVLLNGELRAVMGAAYGWEHLRSGMAVIIRNALLVGIGGLLFTLFSILLILYKRAIAPVTRIQQSINHYIRSRKMEDVARDLDRIQERNEIGVLSDNLSQMVSEIDRYTQENIQLAQERERVETELKLASKIQQAILQRHFPESDAFALSASMSPAREVGGDFYDFFVLDESHLALVIADVSGKGIPAALFMMMAKNMIKNYAQSGLSPSEIMTRTNLNVLENEENTMFVTVWLGFYEIPTGRITAVNAGHEYPMIRKTGGRFELYKDPHSMIIGGYESAVYREYELQLDVGETLFLYTDGAPEATNRAEELLGTDGVLEVLNRDPDGAPEELIEHVESAISTFVGDAPQFDDLTMLVIKRTK